jgi:hypothetical protein
MPEEKKVDNNVTEVAAEESDFSDEAKPISAPIEVEKPVVEAKSAVPAVDLHVEEKPEEQPSGKNPEEKPLKAKAQIEKFTYSDPDLQGIENERQLFFKVYKNSNLIKWVVAAGCLILIVAGWLVPTYLFAATPVFIVTICVVVVALATLLIFSAVFKKRVEKAMKDYFAKYYGFNNHFVFGDKVTNIKGGIDDKLDPEIFKKSNLYKNVFKVGSRECLTFDYKGHSITFADAAATIKGDRSAQTVFVGKFLKTDNSYIGSDIIIYFKGNKRALPPTTLEGKEVFEDSHTMVVYGDKDAKKFLTHDVKQALAAFSTNSIFVDMALSIQAGATYIAMGYEDDLMVLPLEKPFNPAPTKQHQEDMAKIFELLDAIDKSEKHE